MGRWPGTRLPASTPCIPFREKTDCGMTRTVPDRKVILDAVTLGLPRAITARQPTLATEKCRRRALHLFAGRKRLVPATDRSGREMILSCGAVLDHLRVAIAAAGWDTAVARFPDPTQPDHVAAVDFGPLPIVGDTQRAQTDRLPFAAPRGWNTLESTLRGLVDAAVVMLDVVPDDARPQLADASRLTESPRRQDPTYQSELRWRTSSFELEQGVPPTSRVSASEASRVDVARAFPTTGYGERRSQIGPDRSKIIVLSPRGETSLEVLRCGEALSTVLLECTVAGMATCTLTHLTEITPSRMVIRQLTRQRGLSQLLIRVGTTPAAGEQQLPHTPTSRDRCSAVPQVALAAASCSPPATRVTCYPM